MTAPGEAPPPEHAPRVGRYRIAGVLGQGGVGVVHKAWDPELRRWVALKRLKEADCGGPDGLARFLREARLAGRLRHPGIVTAYNVDLIDDVPVLTFEFVAGESLEAWLGRTAAPFTTEAMRERVAMLDHIARAVGFAHAQGVLHRDLKPSNILIDPDGRPRVTDFGMARELADPHGAPAATRLTSVGSILGTPSYMSPEQARGDAGRVDARSDVWALGVMLYEMITGRVPFTGNTVWEVLEAVVLDDPVLPTRIDPGVPAALEAICVRALDKDPARRYESAVALGEDLARWQAGESVAARPTDWRWRAGRWATQRRRVLIPAVVGAVLGASVLGYGFWRRGDQVARSAAIVHEVAGIVADFEHRVMTVAMSPEARRTLAAQPLAVLDAYLATAPELGEAWSWRARIRELMGEEAAARADYDQGCAHAPMSVAPWRLRGWHRLETYCRLRPPPMLHLEIGSLRNLATAPETDAVRQWRIAGLEDLARAAQIASGSELRAMDEGELRLSKVMELYARNEPGDCEQALAVCQGLDQPRSWRMRGRILHQLGRYREAADAYSEVLRRWPEDPDAWQCRGLARVAMAVLDPDPVPGLRDALADLRELDRREPGATAAPVACAKVYRVLARVRKEETKLPGEHLVLALRECDEALRRNPACVPALQIAAGLWVEILYGRMADGQATDEAYDHARTFLERALKFDPDDLATGISCGIFHRIETDLAFMRREDPGPPGQRALDAFARVISRAPNPYIPRFERARTLLTLGLWHYQTGSDGRTWLQEAQSDLDTALRDKPDWPDGLMLRTRVATLRTTVEQEFGADPRPLFVQIIADYERVLVLQPAQVQVRLALAGARFSLGQARAARGEDVGDEWTGALADCEGGWVPGIPPGSYPHKTRARIHTALACLAIDRGEDGSAALAAADADWRAIEAAEPGVGWSTRVLLNIAAGRFAEASATARAWRETSPEDLRLLADRASVLADALCAAGSASWTRDVSALERAVHVNRPAEIESAAGRALAELESNLATLTPEAREQRLGPGGWRTVLVYLAHQRARARMTLAVTQPAPDSDPIRRFDDTMAALAEAQRHGLDLSMVRRDPVFRRLREHPQGRVLLEGK